MNQPNVTGTTPMEGVGRNISETNNRNLTQKRMKRGECPTCGTKTHKVNFFGKKTALTVEGQALYGRCLICNPLEGYARRPPEQPSVPQTLEIMGSPIDDDAGTMVSGITLDYRLVQGARHWDNGGVPEDNFDGGTYDDMEEFHKRAPKSRPEPSLGEVETDDDWRPTNRRYPDSNFGPPPPRRGPPPGHDPRDYPMDRVGSDYGMRGGPGPGPGRPNMGRKPSRPQMYGSSPPRFHGNMGVIEEKDTIGESSSGGNRESLGSAERHQSRGGYQASPEMYDSGYDRGRDTYRGNRYEEKGDIQGPEDYDSQRYDRSYSNNADDRNRQGDRFDQPRGTSSRSLGSDPMRHENNSNYGARHAESARELGLGMDFNRGKMQGDHYDDGYNKAPQDRYGDEFNRNSPSQREYSKPPPAQLQEESLRSRDAYGGGRPKEDEGSYHSASYSQGGRGHPKDDDGPIRRNGRGMPDDDHAVARPARGRTDAAGGPVSGERVKQMFRQLSQADDARVTVDEISTIVSCLNLPEATSKLRERAFEALAEVIWQSGQNAKELVVDNKGIEALVQSMWQDMGDSAVQTSAVELLFALAASPDGEKDSDVLTEMNAEGAVDALLISMQTHVGVEAVQRSGCCTLCCLAAASTDNRDVNDGTLSGAVLSVVNAMDGQQRSLGVQEWGLRALYNQCVYSINSDSNKTSLGRGDYDGGNTVDVIPRSMDVAKSELVTVEWACKLYWCLTSNDDIAVSLASTTKPLHAIVKAVRYFDRNPQAGAMNEAAFGALSNLAKSEQTHAAMREAGVIKMTLDSMKFFNNEEAVNVEACALLANLAGSPTEKEAIVRASGIKPIVKTMGFFPNNAVLQEEALRALITLCIESEDAKKAASSSDAIKTIVQALQVHQDSLAVKEQACSLLASVSARKASVKSIVKNGGIHAIVKAMNSHPRERSLQEVACMALRNVSTLDDDVEDLLDEETVSAIIRAMDTHRDSETVQLNACCVLWNLCSKSQKEPATVVAAGGINNIVKVMQSHMESAVVLEMACGALWSILDNSAECKAKAIESGGIDAVTCALVMHPGEPGCLHMACGVLSSVSVERDHAETIANAQGISIVVEAMRNNSSNASVLEFGALVLRNIVLVNPAHSEEARSAISTIITGMQENPDAVGLQKEACNALWALAAQSEACKSKILALDGVTVIMNTLDRSSDFDVQEAARGAFNQLAMPSYG